MNTEKRFKKVLDELGVNPSQGPKPIAKYLLYQTTGDLVFISGQGCKINGNLRYKGKIGAELKVDEGYKAAKIAAANCLMALKSAVTDLGKVRKIVKLNGYVNSAEDFVEQPLVIDGASELLIEIFGRKRGMHARCALGCSELPNDNPVEVDLLVEINGK
ncbi:MAG TPA: RidA family protein [Aequorivita sp.]|nr:RidA family protein [Aequorivita sp.]